MSLDIRWLAPAALIAVAPQAHAIKYMSIEQAQAAIFAEADEFIDRAVVLTWPQMESIAKRSGVANRSHRQQVWQAMSKGQPLGWFIVDKVIGKHELITYALGVNADGTIRQFQIIEYLEAYGFQVREPKWREQFVGKTVESPLEVGTDIGNISGATMSARHVTDGIRRLLFLHQTVLR
jgi:Na+-translocating ferredoxin:NAD+ oxidoreductase RnfG subunit